MIPGSGGSMGDCILVGVLAVGAGLHQLEAGPFLAVVDGSVLCIWAVGEPWIAKLNRIKVKFGLIAEEKNYKMPPSQHTAPQAEG